MRYSGKAITDQTMTITDVVLTATKLRMAYRDEVGDGHLAATSADGVHYSGTYGYPEPEANRRAWFDLLRRSDGGIAMVGFWREEARYDDPWVIVLDRPATQTKGVNRSAADRS